MIRYSILDPIDVELARLDLAPRVDWNSAFGSAEQPLTVPDEGGGHSSASSSGTSQGGTSSTSSTSASSTGASGTDLSFAPFLPQAPGFLPAGPASKHAGPESIER